MSGDSPPSPEPRPDESSPVSGDAPREEATDNASEPLQSETQLPETQLPTAGEVAPQNAASTSSPAPQVRYRYVRLKPHRASTVLGLGISGVVLAVFGGMMAMSVYFCCPLWLIPLASLGLSIPAWNMGQADLAAMYAGEMDPGGKDTTQIGMICGIMGVSVIALGATVILFIVILYAIIFAIAAASP